MQSTVRSVRRSTTARAFPALSSILSFRYPSAGPALAGIGASLLLALSGLDLQIADRVFAIQGGHWSLAQHPVLEMGLHKLGKQISVGAWLAVLALLACASVRPGLSSWRRPLAYLAVSVLSATVVVSVVKKLSGVDCPWDLARYGGTEPYTTLLRSLTTPAPQGGCFPAGHASAGYAWVALFFFLGATRPRLRWAGLGVAMFAGLAFGIAQQIRGAHFASHDAMTFAICWFVSWLCFRLFGLAWLPAVRNAAQGQPA